MWAELPPSLLCQGERQIPVPEPVFISKMEPKGRCGRAAEGCQEPPPTYPLPPRAIYTHHLKCWAEGSPGEPLQAPGLRYGPLPLSTTCAWPLCCSPSPRVTVAQKKLRGGREARQGGKEGPEGLPHPGKAPLLLSPINRE